MIIAWANFVNQKILDSTSISIGEGGKEEQEDESKSFSETNLTSIAIPDTFSVQMDFDWSKKLDDDGNEVLPTDENYIYAKSELDRFVEWYKYEHKRGVNPFEFPSITKFNVNGSVSTGIYKITSTINLSKSGFSQRVQMTWKEVYTGAIQIPERIATVDYLECKNGDLIATYTITPPTTKPTKTSSRVAYKLETETNYTNAIVSQVIRNGKTVIIAFARDDGSLLPSGTYDIRFSDDGGTTHYFTKLQVA